MIKRFLPTETIYNHNKYILKPLRAEVVEEANGMFELEIELPKGTQVSRRDIITAPTPRGVQPFRVYRITKTLQGIRAYARHIFYDLANALLLDVRPTNTNVNGALQSIFNAVGWSGWSYLSDITDLRTAYYIRKNPVEAIIGAENSILNVWGGNLVRNGKEVRINASGIDRGYEIRLGKNLIGIEDDSDDSNVVTRLYPTFERNQVIYGIPEGYVDSPLVGNYPTPIAKEIRVALTDEQKELPDADIYDILRDFCDNLYSVDNVDKPVVNYKIDFVQLAKVARMAQERKYTYAGLEQLTYQTLSTLTYGELQSVNVIEQFTDLLEKVDLYDLVKIKVKELDIDLQARVISYRYDCLGERYAKLELGGFKPSNQYQTSNIVQQIKNEREKASDEFRELYDLAINQVTGNNGGYQITRRNANNEPYETLWMDTPDIQTAQKVLRINQNGIAGSENGFNGPYNVAITTDGYVVAERILANQLSAISANLGTVTTGKLISTDGTVSVDLDNKEIRVGASDAEVHSVLKFNGLEIRDGDKTLGSFGETGAVIPNADIAELRSPKVMQITSPGAYTVGTGGTFLTLQEAFDRLFIDGNRFLNDQVLLLVYGQHSGDIIMSDIYGGTIIVRLMDGAKIYGSFIGRNMYTALTIESGGTGRGYVDGVDDYPFQFSRCFNVVIENLDLSGVTTGMFANATNIVTRGLDFGTNKFYYGIVAERGSNALMINNRGRVTGNRAEVRNAVIYQQGEVPFSGLGDSILGGTIINTAITEANSSYNPPAVTSKTFVQIFTGGIFDTIKHGTTSISTYYGASAAQNRWDSSVGWVDGRIRFGSEIYNFFNGGSNISIRMRLRRNNSSHGSSGAVMPAPYNHSASYPSGATRGGWTGWATVPSSLFTSGGATLTYYNGVQGSAGYAIWDAVEIEVTVTKNV